MLLVVMAEAVQSLLHSTYWGCVPLRRWPHLSNACHISNKTSNTLTSDMKGARLPFRKMGHLPWKGGMCVRTCTGSQGVGYPGR